MASAKKKHTPREGGQDVRWHAVVIIVSSQATYNQVIDRPCSCILALGTNATHKIRRTLSRPSQIANVVAQDYYGHESSYED